MMKDFKQTTEQLRELAKVLNEFKSETVQIKLIELLFNKNFVISTDTPESPVKEIITETKIEEKQVEEQTTEPEVNVEEKPVKVAKPKQAKVAAPPVKVIRKRSTTSHPSRT